ncbi:MAG: sensor histidine kinase [Gammaproteobacteria bacterium]|nr:sensor histidine kinase [Gammaproteobacteria bacterium]NNM00313.1 sensor histidine kinase [Gammaproteobacteria bacterium]
MKPQQGANPLEPLYTSRRFAFWLLQAAGWSGLCVISFLSLTVWYDQVQVSYILHTLVQSALGLLLSLPLWRALVRLSGRPLRVQVPLALAAIVVTAVLWTVLRIATFTWLTAELDVWSDFGGWFFASFIIYLSWVAIYYGAKFYALLQDEHEKRRQLAEESQQEHIRRLRAESLAIEAQLQMLRYQLNPHFLFNTLNSINALVRLGDDDRAEKMIVQLSKFLRYSLEHNAGTMVPLEQEIESSRLYLDIEQTRFGDRLRLDFDIDHARTGKVLVPTLILQPLVENAVKHGIARSESGGAISLYAAVDGDDLVLRCADTGPGLGEDAGIIESERGVGLRNTRERLQILYGERQSINTRSADPHGLIIELRLPLDYALPSKLVTARPADTLTDDGPGSDPVAAASG